MDKRLSDSINKQIDIYTKVRDKLALLKAEYDVFSDEWEAVCLIDWLIERELKEQCEFLENEVSG